MQLMWFYWQMKGNCCNQLSKPQLSKAWLSLAFQGLGIQRSPFPRGMEQHDFTVLSKDILSAWTPAITELHAWIWPWLCRLKFLAMIFKVVCVSSLSSARDRSVLRSDRVFLLIHSVMMCCPRDGHCGCQHYSEACSWALITMCRVLPWNNIQIGIFFQSPTKPMTRWDCYWLGSLLSRYFLPGSINLTIDFKLSWYFGSTAMLAPAGSSGLCCLTCESLLHTGYIHGLLLP